MTTNANDVRSEPIPLAPPPPPPTAFSNETTRILSIIGLVMAGCVFVLILTVYTLHRPYPQSVGESAARTRLDTLTAVLRQHFGDSWPYLLLGFSLILAILAFVLFLRSPDSEWKINIQEPAATRVLTIVVCIFVLMGIGLVSLFVQVFVFQPSTSTTQATIVADATETDAERQKRLTWLYGTALVLIVLFGATFFIGYIRRVTE